jgi:hypothetical protein
MAGCKCDPTIHFKIVHMSYALCSEHIHLPSVEDYIRIVLDG